MSWSRRAPETASMLNRSTQLAATSDLLAGQALAVASANVVRCARHQQHLTVGAHWQAQLPKLNSFLEQALRQLIRPSALTNAFALVRTTLALHRGTLLFRFFDPSRRKIADRAANTLGDL